MPMILFLSRKPCDPNHLISSVSLFVFRPVSLLQASRVYSKARWQSSMGFECFSVSIFFCFVFVPLFEVMVDFSEA